MQASPQGSGPEKVVIPHCIFPENLLESGFWGIRMSFFLPGNHGLPDSCRYPGAIFSGDLTKICHAEAKPSLKAYKMQNPENMPRRGEALTKSLQNAES
jgi:hypothetical protein